jgi:hypothetical protein
MPSVTELERYTPIGVIGTATGVAVVGIAVYFAFFAG